MPFGRVNFFIGDGKFTWSETYYASNTSLGLEDLMSQAKHLADIRTSLMANYIGDTTGKNGVSLDEIRVSLDDTWRDSLIDRSRARGGASANYPKPGTFTSRPERPYSCLLLRCDGNDLGNKGQYRKVIYLSGMPESVIQDPDGANIFLPPAFGLNLNLFINELTQKPAAWGFKVRLKNLAAPESPISKVTFDVPNQTAQIVVPNTQYIDPATSLRQQFLLIRGCKFDPPQRGCNGMREYQLTPALPPAQGALPNTYTLLNTPANLGTIYKGGGVARQLIYGVVPIDSVTVDVETHRKRGVRSLAPLGRSKKRT